MKKVLFCACDQLTVHYHTHYMGTRQIHGCEMVFLNSVEVLNCLIESNVEQTDSVFVFVGLRFISIHFYLLCIFTFTFSLKFLLCNQKIKCCYFELKKEEEIIVNLIILINQVVLYIANSKPNQFTFIWLSELVNNELSIITFHSLCFFLSYCLSVDENMNRTSKNV